MATRVTLIQGSDNLLKLSDLTDVSQQGSTVINTATVTANVRNAATDAVVVGPITLDFISGSTGDYEGVLTDVQADGLTVNSSYMLEVVADDGVNRKRTWRAVARVLAGG